METKETAAAYDRLAAHWDGDDFNRENGIAQHIRALQFVKEPTINQTRAAIDIGCGSSGRIIDLLNDRNFEAEGLDISAEMIERARRRHPQNTFHHADFMAWKWPRNYEFISAWDSVWHVPLAQQESMLRHLCAGLAPGGVLITTTGGMDGPSDVTNPCHGQPLYHAALGIRRFLDVLADCGCICRHLEYDQWPELHVYIVAQKTET